LMLLFMVYLRENGFQRIHQSPNMVKYRHAYYEACTIMINQSASKETLAKLFDTAEILRAPTEQEFENEINTLEERRAASQGDKSVKPDRNFDEDCEDDEDDHADEEDDGVEKSVSQASALGVMAVKKLDMQQDPADGSLSPQTVTESLLNFPLQGGKPTLWQLASEGIITEK